MRIRLIRLNKNPAAPTRQKPNPRETQPVVPPPKNPNNPYGKPGTGSPPGK